jgi:hypothetical protein
MENRYERNVRENYDRNVRQRIRLDQCRLERMQRQWWYKACMDHDATTPVVSEQESRRSTVKPWIPIGLPIKEILWGFIRHNGTLTQRIDETLEITRLPRAFASIVREYDADVNIDRLVVLVGMNVYSFCRTESQLQPETCCRRHQIDTHGAYDEYRDILQAYRPERGYACNRTREQWRHVIFRNVHKWFLHHQARQTNTRTVTGTTDTAIP